ncbi:BREX protein BrxB domain-containing protein [Cellulophaga sp. L1A9]|uniref:BREX protein BrxB domain-containing protein n=1 Tax=Cellulophaga sp. L1A9 TaxID=2686362 RepID=UPI00131B20A5|nr:BREX protein BrxB domain-containing protein [Cellulophaga sp. L1A9]
MTIAELYTHLANDDFKDYETGNLFFPAYMYMYNAENEYQIDAEILDIKNRLHRPTNYLDVIVLDIYEEFIMYLKQEKFAKSNKFDFYNAHENKKPEAVNKSLFKDAYDTRFLEFLNNKIQAHLKIDDSFQRSYVFIKGFGNAFPYIRASRFFNNFEKYVKGYKLIMFYPGEAKEYYSLFGLLKDENLYRAIKLINE